MMLDDDAIIAATVGKTIKDPEMQERFGSAMRSLCAAARRGEPAHLRAVLQSYRESNPAPDDPIEAALAQLQGAP